MTHHAVGIIGDAEGALLSIPEEDREAGVDVTAFKYRQLTIADARALNNLAAQRPFQKPERIFILTFESATTEAQNALLKLFEEPTLTSRFYLIFPLEDVLLPTLRSRLMLKQVIHTNAEGALAKEFLRASYAERLELIAAKLKDTEETWSLNLIRELEYEVRGKGKTGAEALVFIAEYMRAPGASKKMLLEHLALSL